MRHANRYFAMLIGASLLFLVLGSSLALATPVTPTGPFSGDYQETWEGFGIGDLSNPTSIMSGAASIQNDAAGGGDMTIYNTGANAFGLGGSGTAQTVDGTQGMGVNDIFDLTSTTTITFATPVSAFGAYWAAATNGNVDPVTVTLTFYDALDVPLGPAVNFNYSGDGTLEWHGWSAVVGESIAKVEYVGSGVAVDSLQALSAVPEPSSLVLLAAGLLGLVACNWCRRRYH